jgi:hypothetical protein
MRDLRDRLGLAGFDVVAGLAKAGDGGEQKNEGGPSQHSVSP